MQLIDPDFATKTRLTVDIRMVVKLVLCLVGALVFPFASSFGTDDTSKPQGGVRLIDLDVNSVAGPMSDAFRKCVGAGRANEGLRADWQRQLRQAKEACGFEYIRMHGLLCDDMGVYREEH